MINAIIIDDEERARNVLETILTDYCPEVTVLAKAEDVPKGVIAINKFNPDVVFLDIEMPNYSGFELLDFFNEVNFEIIFVTAYSEYAIKAFEVSAIDYVLKPLEIEKIEDAVAKLKQRQESKNAQERVNTLKENLGGSHFEKIALPVADGLKFIKINNIKCIEADGSYSRISFRNNNKSITISKRLKFFEDLLRTVPFMYRSHRSVLVNLNSLQHYNKADNLLLLDGDQPVKLAREKKQEFELLIAEIKL